MKELEFKEGDKVFSFRDGFQTLISSNSTMYTLRAGAKGACYTRNGKFSTSDEYRSLLTIKEAKALGIEVPKKKVEIKLWANIFPHMVLSYGSKEDADKNTAGDKIACVEMTGEYFVDDV